MYKLLLCTRYLRTFYIALASIISVMLGVATMVVVNAVMAGFTTEMQDRIHGILSDVVFASHSLSGFPDAAWHEEQIRQVAGDDIVGMTPVVAVPAIINIQCQGSSINQQVQLIGIDPATQGLVSDFSKYLNHPENRRSMSFDLHDGGYDTRDHQAGPDAPERHQMADGGWKHRRKVDEDRQADATSNPPSNSASSLPEDLHDLARTASSLPDDLLELANTEPINTFDPSTQQHTGVVLGIALASRRVKRMDGSGEYEDWFAVLPGDDIQITLPTAGEPPKGITDTLTVVDFYESKMSEYDSSFVFVPIEYLQKLRGMVDPSTGTNMVSSIQIKLRDGADPEVVRDKLRAAFPASLFSIATWRDKQGPLLAAVDMEVQILNVLLFLIIAVAGFGILAIFLMIVVEKTRDIGILKSLGASGGGIMQIFLAYGLSLGLVGSSVGLVLGLLFVRYINSIADGLAWVTGRPVFDPEIYYFDRIPTIVEPTTLVGIVVGALVIAVAASVLPAFRAARLRPVEALRHG